MLSFLISLFSAALTCYAAFVFIGLAVASLSPGRTWSFKLLGFEILRVEGSAPALLAQGEPTARSEEEEDAAEGDDDEEYDDDDDDDDDEDADDDDDDDADEGDDEDMRTLEERLTDLGIALIGARAAPEAGDIGGVFLDTEAYEEDCPACEQDTLHPFGEIVDGAPDAEAHPARPLRNRLGSACNSCGHLDINAAFVPLGRFAPLVGDRVELELFPILRAFEQERVRQAV